MYIYHMFYRQQMGQGEGHICTYITCFTDSKCARVKATQVPCTVLSMAFFDRLYEDNKIAREGGLLVKCYDDFYEGITISDELRKVSTKRLPASNSI